MRTSTALPHERKHNRLPPRRLLMSKEGIASSIISLLAPENDRKQIAGRHELEKLFRMYELARSQGEDMNSISWYRVALKLAQKHEPKLQNKSQIGRPKKWTDMPTEVRTHWMTLGWTHSHWHGLAAHDVASSCLDPPQRQERTNRQNRAGSNRILCPTHCPAALS